MVMFMTTRIAALLLAFFFQVTAWAESENGAKVPIKGELVSRYCSEYFGFVSVRFGNPTDRWLTLSNVQIGFGDSRIDDAVNVVTGPSLEAWRRAMSAKLASDDIDSQTFLGAIAVIGILAVGSRDSTAQGIGAAAALSSTGVAGVNEIGNARAEIKAAGMVPDTHLLAGDIIVPPGLFADRWILLNTKSDGSAPYLEWMRVSFVEGNNPTENHDLVLRGAGNRGGCGWQRRVPRDTGRQ